VSSIIDARDAACDFIALECRSATSVQANLRRNAFVVPAYAGIHFRFLRSEDENGLRAALAAPGPSFGRSARCALVRSSPE